MAADDKDLNRDPLTEEPGAHPVGTGIGAAGGAVAGAAAGTVGGPIGSMVGGVIGAVVGGLAGKAAAEAVNPTAEEAHWRGAYTSEPYYEQGRSFDDYGPAYMHGVNARMQHTTDWDAAEPRLASEWERARGMSNLSWDQARPASRAAWDRVERQQGSGSMGSDTATVRAMDLAAGPARSGGTDMVGASVGAEQSDDLLGSQRGQASTQATGAAGMVGAAQTAGNTGSDTKDVVDILQDLVECCKDGEYGFRESGEQVKRQDLKTVMLQRADDCRRGADELNECIRRLGGSVQDSGSAMGSLHRGWVSVRTALTTYDDKAVLQECERGEDNALARYRKALNKPLPEDVRQLVQRQCDGVQRNHDQIRMLRDSTQ